MLITVKPVSAHMKFSDVTPGEPFLLAGVACIKLAAPFAEAFDEADHGPKNYMQVSPCKPGWVATDTLVVPCDGELVLSEK